MTSNLKLGGRPTGLPRNFPRRFRKRLKKRPFPAYEILLKTIMPMQQPLANLSICPLRREDLPQVQKFCDQEIGTDYYSLDELENIYQKSQKNSVMCSFVLIEGSEKIHGIRISYPSGQWTHGKGQGLRPELWGVPIEKVGYFQSLFLAKDVQAQGWGQKLSQVALDALTKTGAIAVVCHAWCESPHDSSRRYLRKLGFQTVVQHPLYWNKVDYECPRCGRPCVCTAEEMIRRFT